MLYVHWRSPRAVRLARPALVLTAVVLLMALPACAPTGSVPPKATATATATSAPVVLYQANWSHGLGDWQATPGWTVVDGALQSDTGQDRAITIPYQPATPNYTVEYQIQILNILVTGGYYQLAALPQPGRNGYVASINGLRALGSPFQSGDHPHLQTWIDPMDAEGLAMIGANSHDFDPGTALRTYRVTVQGPLMQFYVDGLDASNADSSATSTLANGPLRFMCGLVSLRISNLRILSA
jgi:hypothetical protein